MKRIWECRGWTESEFLDSPSKLQEILDDFCSEAGNIRIPQDFWNQKSEEERKKMKKVHIIPNSQAVIPSQEQQDHIDREADISQKKYEKELEKIKNAKRKIAEDSQRLSLFFQNYAEKDQVTGRLALVID